MSKKEKKIIIILILSLVFIDQIIKIIMQVSGMQFSIGNFNFGIIKGERTNENIKYILINIIAGTALIRYMINNNTFIKLNTRVVISFAIAGVISNIIDRIFIGYAQNYILISGFLGMNLSYIYITITWIGMAIILAKNTGGIFRKNRKL